VPSADAEGNLARLPPDLRSFLAEHDHAVFRPPAPLSVVHEITALQHALWRAAAQPVIRLDRPRLADGTLGAMPVVTNLFASRALCAAALGIADHREAARSLAQLAARPIAPVVVARADAPVQAVVFQGSDADATRLPAFRQHVGDAGHYISAGHLTTCDPDSGTDNAGIQRCLIRGPRLLGCYLTEISHNYRNMRKFWARGEPCPVAIWLGHHPAVSIGAQTKQAYPASHWSAAGGTIGAPLRLVPSITHGEQIMVPADAEIVIEGFIPPNRLEAEGPFAEYTGYTGPQLANPVIEIACITQRRDAIYVDCGSGLPDHLIPDNLSLEGSIYAVCRSAAPALVNVHVPFSGRRYHAYLQFGEARRGEVRDTLAAALSYRRLKLVVAVDTDIDIFDDRHVMWALATRAQWHRDLMRIDGLTAPYLDPTLPRGWTTASKIAIDATLPQAKRPDAPRPVSPPNRVDTAALDKATALLGAVDTRQWPRA